MNIKRKLSFGSYKEYVQKKMPKSKTFLDCIKAFFVGGAICTVGQGIRNLAMNVFKMDKEGAGAVTSITMIFLGALFTGIGIYDVLGNFAGAGSIVPITGFANSIVSPALEFKREGYVLGVGAKLFAIAGPVIVYGVCSSIFVGLVYYILLALGLRI